MSELINARTKEDHREAAEVSADATRYRQSAVNIIRRLESHEPRDAQETAARGEYLSHLITVASNPPVKRCVLVRIEDETVVESLITLHRTRVNKIAAHKRLEAAADRVELAQKSLDLEIEERMGFADGEEFLVDTLGGVLVSKEESGPHMIDFRELAFSLAGNASCEDLQPIAEGRPGNGLAVMLTLEEEAKLFVRDLAHFLLENGRDGARLVREICTDLDAARRQDQWRPVNFLAKTVVSEGPIEG